ncbi:hypothetical protein G9A89_006728 [Geosiphon pyriformis]|nr:hypothetical protein G9A89_006728 [Geosiphon pyriformis]
MDPAGSSAGVSDLISTRLESWSGSKKKTRIKSIYFYGASFKKVRKPVVSGTVVDSSAGLLYADLLLADGGKCKASWDSKVENESNNISEVSNLEDMENLVAEETSYINSNTFGNNDLMDDTTPRKTRTRTYVLDKPPKQPSFNLENNNNSVLELPPRTFVGSNQLLLPKSHGLKCHCFKPVKSFALDVELSAVPGKLNSNKLFKIKKIFYKIDGFGGASTSLKFSGIIRSTFTSESSLVKKVIIKEIPVDLFMLAVELVLSKFGRIVSIKLQLIGLWQKALVEFESSEVASLVTSKWDCHQALLYTLPVGTTTHDLSGLIDSYGKKTCFIGSNPNSYICDQCAVICFENEASKLAAIGTILIFKGVNLHWAGLSLACCAKCQQFGHVSSVCSVSENAGSCDRCMVTSQNQICLAGIYKQKQALIARPVFFDSKTWAQVAGSSPFHVVSSEVFGVGTVSGVKLSLKNASFFDIFNLSDWLGSLEHSLELVADQVSDILKRLSFVELVPLPLVPHASLPAISAPVGLDSAPGLDMVVDVLLVSCSSPLLVIDDAAPDIGLSSSKILTAKIGGLESKLMTLDASVGSVLAKLDFLCSGSGSVLTPFSQ